MIAFAQIGNRDEVLSAFNKVTGTEKKDCEFISDIQKIVSDEVSKIPESVKSIGLEVKARPTSKENLGVEVFVYKFS